jgi:hypothetical protein
VAFYSIAVSILKFLNISPKITMNVFNTNTVSKKNNTVNTVINIYKQTICLMFILILSNSVYAEEENIVYVCVADDGTPTYTNNKVGLTNCKPLSGVFVTTIPAFKIPAVESQPSNNNFNNNFAVPRTNNNLLRPSNFPREDVSSQRQRDELGRRPILETELRDREARCAATMRTLRAPLPRLAGETDAAFGQRITAIQAQVERCNADLAAIRRELAALK